MTTLQHSASMLAEHVRRGDVRAIDLVEKSLNMIGAHDERINAFRETWANGARAAAEDVDRRAAKGKPLGLLAGVPVAIKDNLATREGYTCCGSRMLSEYKSAFDATSVTRLRREDAILIGKTNCDEFAMGSSTEHCAFGPAHNPWDEDRVPGGSSGGSAAAVAAGFCPLALGSDTGGSIRQPAALCGIVGAKPSYGRVSRHGLVAFGSSLDQVGPLSRSVTDAALVSWILSGHDEKDATTSGDSPPPWHETVDTPVDELRIGFAPQHATDAVDPAVAAIVEQSLDTFRQLGAKIVEIDLPLVKYGIATYYVLATAEASSNLARYDGIRYGYSAERKEQDDLIAFYSRTRAEALGPEVKRRIMLGTYVLSAGYYDAYYRRAQQVRRRIREEYETAFGSCHAILGPTSPIPAFRIGEKVDPLALYLCDVFTANTNIAGICGLSMPGGLTPDGLPVGIHLQCPAFDEETMFKIARMFENATRHHLALSPVHESAP